MAYEVHQTLKATTYFVCFVMIWPRRFNFLHLHLSLNRQGRWGTADDFTISFLAFFLSVFHCPLGLGELQACPFSDVVFPPLPLSALSSSPFHCALRDGFRQT